MVPQGMTKFRQTLVHTLETEQAHLTPLGQELFHTRYAECGRLANNWLRVSGTAELPQIDQRVCQQLRAIMPPLDTFKTEQESLEFILPGKGALDAHPQRMNSGVEQAFASALRSLAVAGILFDIGDQAGIENALAIVRGIKATIEVERSASEVQLNLFGDLLQGVQALW